MGRFHDRMDDDLRIRGYSANTRACYLRCVRNFVRHFMRPPDQTKLALPCSDRLRSARWQVSSMTCPSCRHTSSPGSSVCSGAPQMMRDHRAPARVVILHVNHTAPHGRLAAPASELVGALLALVEDGYAPPAHLPAAARLCRPFSRSALYSLMAGMTSRAIRSIPRTATSWAISPSRPQKIM